MRKFALVFVVAVCSHLSARCQEGTHGYGATSSFGISGTFSPDSSHILIGDSGQRRIWTAGGEYTHRLYQTPFLRLDYEGSISPFYKETDPTVIGTEFTADGVLIVDKQSPVRVQHVDYHPVGTVLTGSGARVPLYALFSKESTYAALVAPLGVRVSAMPRRRFQPSMALDLGFIISARDIPLDDCSQFNYMFAIGPGLQFFTTARTSIRAEYLYRHISNAGQGAQNPGIDQGVVRVTLSLHR